MTALPLVLLIEDEPSMRRFLRVALANHGFRVVEAENAKEGLEQAKAYVPDVVLLDLGLPDQDGLAVTKELRGWSAVPIVVVSARGQEKDKIGALDAGADDYLTKPFGTGELMARIRVALRHAARAGTDTPDAVLDFGDLVIDLTRRRVTVAGAEVHLTPTEYKLLITMAKSAGKVLTHRHLLQEVWGPSHTSQPEYLRVYMGQLRHKLEKDPARPKHLVTELGVGYRFRGEEEERPAVHGPASSAQRQKAEE